MAGLITADVAWHQLILAQLTEKYLKEEQQLRLKFNSYEKRASDLILLPLKVFVQGGRKTPSQASPKTITLLHQRVFYTKI